MARLSLSREGRDSLERYMIQQASLAGITTERLGKTFSVDPSIQQKMETPSRKAPDCYRKSILSVWMTRKVKKS